MTSNHALAHLLRQKALQQEDTSPYKGRKKKSRQGIGFSRRLFFVEQVFFRALLGLLVIVVVVNMVLGRYGQRIVSSLRTGPYRLSVENVFYAFPNQVLLYGVRLRHRDAPGRQGVVPFATVCFSLGDLARFGRWRLSGITARYPVLTGYDGMDGFQEDLVDLWRNVAGGGNRAQGPGGLRVVIHKGRLKVRREEWTADVDVQRNRDKVQGRLNARSKRPDGRTMEVSAVLKGRVDPSGDLIIHKLKLADDSFETTWRGTWKKRVFSFSGFGFWRERQRPGRIRHYLTDLRIDGQRIATGWRLNMFKGAFDEVPFLMTGYWTGRDPVQFVGEMVSGSRTKSIRPARNPQKLHVRLQGILRGRGARLRGEASYETLINERDLRVVWRFPEGLLWKGGPTNEVATVPRSVLRIAWDQDTVTVPLRDITIGVYPEAGASGVDIQAEVFGGQIRGKIKSQGSWLVQLEMKDVQLTPDAFLPSSGSFISGLLDGRIRLQRLAPLLVEGQGVLRQGRLARFPFLDWLADYFALPEIQALPFNALSAHFRLAQDSLLVNNISMDAPDLTFKGGFQLDKDRFLSSRFTVALRKRLMDRSSRLKALVKRLPGAMDPVPFDFRLTGRPEALNFQWLASDTRESFMEKVPRFILRRIERYVEEMR